MFDVATEPTSSLEHLARALAGQVWKGGESADESLLSRRPNWVEMARSDRREWEAAANGGLGG